MRFILLIVLSLLCLVPAGAQPPHRFITSVGGPGADFGKGLQMIDSSRYIIVGSTTSYGNGASDVYLVCIDSMGVPMWRNTFGGTGNDVGNAIIVNPKDSGFVIVGYSSSFSYDYQIYLLRTNKHGNLIWERTIGGEDWDFGTDVALTIDSNIVITGYTHSTSYGKSDGFVAKISMTSGHTIWERHYGGLDDDNFLKIKYTSDGFYTLAGNTKSYGDINNDYWLFKINESGDSIRSTVIGTGGKSEYLYDFIEDNKNDLVLCGSYDTSTANSGRNIAYMVKTTLNGSVLKTKGETDGGHDDDKYVAISKIRYSDLFVVCRKYNKFGFYGIQVHPILWDYDFNYWHSNDYGGSGIDEASAVVDTWNNGFAIVGYTKGFDLSAADAFLIRLVSNLDSSNVYIATVPELDRPNAHSGIFLREDEIVFQNDQNEILGYELIDASGNLKLQGNTSASTVTIPASVPNGFYVFRLTNSHKTAKKLILSR